MILDTIRQLMRDQPDLARVETSPDRYWLTLIVPRTADIDDGGGNAWTFHAPTPFQPMTVGEHIVAPLMTDLGAVGDPAPEQLLSVGMVVHRVSSKRDVVLVFAQPDEPPVVVGGGRVAG